MTRTRDPLTEPGALLRCMFHDLDRWREPRAPVAEQRRPATDVPWIPPLEMSERNGQLLIRVDLPGLKEENIGVSVAAQRLVIEGERAHEAESRNNEWFATERTYGRFYRVVPLPEAADCKQVKATFRNGVLEITVPIPAAANAPVRVPVEGESQAKSPKVAA